VVVSVDPVRRNLRLRGIRDECSDLRCGHDTVVVADEETTSELDALSPGDIVKIEAPADGPQRIVVLRRAWEEYASPEL
jgi:hypothetical protein